MSTRAAKRYAKAILSLAQEQDKADVIYNNMTTIIKVINDNKALNVMIKNPVLKRSDKQNVLKAIFKNTDGLIYNLIDTLTTNKRLDLLQNISISYTKLYDKLQGKKEAIVTTAVPIDNDLKNKVLTKIQELGLGNDVEIINKMDTNIIGGFILRIDDIEYNASIANQLNKLKREFILN